jgi:hypothetical protein
MFMRGSISRRRGVLAGAEWPLTGVPKGTLAH